MTCRVRRRKSGDDQVRGEGAQKKLRGEFTGRKISEDDIWWYSPDRSGRKQRGSCTQPCREGELKEMGGSPCNREREDRFACGSRRRAKNWRRGVKIRIDRKNWGEEIPSKKRNTVVESRTYERKGRRQMNTTP